MNVVRDGSEDEGDYAVSNVELPISARFPETRRTRNGHAAEREVLVWRQRFESGFLVPHSQDEKLSSYRWLVGHDHLFLYWLTLSLAFEQVTAAIQNGNVQSATLWIDRASRLMLGSIGAMINSGDFSTETYRDFIRPSMLLAREDFSAASSKEHMMMMLSLQEMRDAMKRAGFGSEAVVPGACTLGDAYQGFRQAAQTWYHEHDAIALRLEPSDRSLLAEKLRKMKEEGQSINWRDYINNVVRSPGAQQDYDRYFGVIRTQVLALEDLEAMLLHTLDRVRLHLSCALTPQQMAWLVEGDLMLLTITAERLVQAPSPVSA